ncbi:hypothetical protein PG984_007333 [Apiospora sp. TS-2023a]
MDGFVIVSLIRNNTYNGSEASLKASEINNTYVVRASDFQGSEQWMELTAIDPNYTPFYGLWAYLLFASVLFIPALTWLVLYIWKLHVDRKNDAREERQRAPTPPPQRDAQGSIELQPLRGSSASPPNPPEPAPRAAGAGAV